VGLQGLASSASQPRREMEQTMMTWSGQGLKRREPGRYAPSWWDWKGFLFGALLGALGSWAFEHFILHW